MNQGDLAFGFSNMPLPRYTIARHLMLYLMGRKPKVLGIASALDSQKP